SISGFIFSRILIVSCLVLIQIAIICVAFIWFYDFIEYIWGGFSLLSIVLVVWIINDQSNPAFKLAWVLPVLVFPVVGGFLYLFIETNFGGKTFNKNVQQILNDTKFLLKTKDEVRNQLKEKPLNTLSTYIENVSGFPVYQNTTLEYFPLGEAKFAAMKQELSLAKEFIFLEYFIIQEGIMWNEILAVLVKKAAEGVDVRVMYDGIGTIRTLPINYDKQLKAMGIKAKVFSPVVPLVSTHQNNRDHRKILVIDGKVAFNGGINLADEYINQKKVHGHWKDVAIILKGEAVKSFTLMFLQMWNIDEKRKEAYTPYLEDKLSCHSSGFVIPYCDNPLDSDRVGEIVYMDMIYKAKNYVHIMTPYLIIDNEMLTALSVAAKSGVDVKIMMPHIPDQKVPFDTARSYYPQLLKAGVKIYEYTPGFVHAKMFVCDGNKAVVGTINLDYRSLYHHFECATYMEDVESITAIEEDFNDTLNQCQQVSMKTYKQLPWIKRLMGKIYRLLAPLM
ncbi:MAG: cardiolipin synthase, partial [Erysipelotrichaceae bacterium]